MATPRKGYWIGKQRLPSVTTILSRFKESGGLMHWAFKQGQSGAAHLYEERDKAANCGTMAHEMVEHFVNGEDHMQVLEQYRKEATESPAEQKEMIQKALNAFQMFREWHENNKIEIVSKWQEIQMVSDKYEFGGTPDAIGRNVNGELVLLDWKTSNSVYQDYLLQLSAYKQLWEENNPDDPITGGFYLCRFSKDFPDYSTHYFEELDDAWEMFKCLLKAYGYDKILKKRVK